MKLLKSEKYIIVITLVLLAMALGFGFGQRQGEASFSLGESGFKGRGELAVESATANGVQQGLININSCTREELEALPGIGPVLAQRIIDYRTSSGGFRTVEDITKVQGIGVVVYEKVYMLICVD